MRTGPSRDAGDQAPLQAVKMADMLFIEICAGSAVLSSAIHHIGLQTLSIDHEFNRFEAHAAITQLD